MLWFVVNLRNGKYSPECDETQSTQFALQENSKQTPDTHTESDDDNCSKKNVGINDSTKITPPPVYAIPDKLKSKKALGSSDGKMEKDNSFCEQTKKPTGVQDLQNEVVCTACMHTCTTFPCLPRTN